MNKGNVLCKECGKKFSYQQWHDQKICENPQCNCPSVQQSMKMAQQTIDKMKDSVKVINLITVTTNEVPDGEDEAPKGVSLYEYSVPKVMAIKITPPGARGVISKKHRGGK